jgi:hypothetical protein
LKSHIEWIDLQLLWRKGWILLALATISSAVAADVFFYDHPLGWTAGAYLLLLIVLVILRSWRSRRSRVIPGLLLAVIGLIFALIESPTRFNLVCAIAALGSLALAIRSSSPIGMRCWIARWSALAIAPFTRPFQDLWRAARWIRRHPASAARPLRTVGLWMIPVGLGSLWLFEEALCRNKALLQSKSPSPRPSPGVPGEGVTRSGGSATIDGQRAESSLKFIQSFR